MKFLNRQEEMQRLLRLGDTPGGLAVIWGRRRVGKSRLLLEWVKATGGLYWVADESAGAIQRRYFAETVASVLRGFADVDYPDWRSLFDRLAHDSHAAGFKGPLVLDELPYLVAADASFASILQHFVDGPAKAAGLTLALAGSSQRMMQGAVLDASAPLYGRATELIRLQPLPAGHITEALGLGTARQAVEAFSLWGGIPRYWELASPFADRQAEAVCDLVLDPMGPLHEEPHRLLLEEIPSAASLRPILDAIGMGAHRTSEIASRVGQPATSLTRPLGRLQELGLIYRELPFGDAERGGKRALYKLADPFLRLWFRVVAPRRSMLAMSTATVRRRLLASAMPTLISEAWEELCRQALPRLSHQDDRTFNPGDRYWHGQGPEWDVVATDIDSEVLLLGESKWTAKRPTQRFASDTVNALRAKGAPPVKRPGTTHYALFVPEAPAGKRLRAHDLAVYAADDVLAALR